LASDILAAIVPKSVVATLQHFRERGASILFIQGPACKTPALPPTPTAGFGNDADVQVYDAILLGVQRVCGIVPVAFEFENQSRLMRNVVPNPRSKGQRSSYGYDQALGFHTDNPCGEFEDPSAPWTRSTVIPRYLSFVGLRNRDGRGKPVTTDVLPLDAIRQHVSAEAFQCLQKPLFQVNPPPSNSCAARNGVALVQLLESVQVFRFDSDPEIVFGLTEEANWALGEFKDALRAAQAELLRFDLSPVSVLVFDN
jgi:hypothetical protein